MQIKFLKDFRGKETQEAFFLKGSVTEISNADFAKRLIDLGFAEQVGEPEKKSVEKTKAPKEK